FTEADTGAQTLTADGSFTATDVDLTDVLSASHAAASVDWSGGDVADLPDATIAALSAVGVLSLTPDFDADTNILTVAWNYASGDVDLNFLGKDETLTLTFPVTASDDAETPGTVVQNIVLTITGTNDAPEIAAS